MPGKCVRFRDSPSISPPSGSQNKNIPLPLLKTRINPKLSTCERLIHYDLTFPPENALVHPKHLDRYLNDPATDPALPSMTIVCEALPHHPISVAASQRRDGVTVMDVLCAIYRHLRTPASEADFAQLSPDAQRRASAAFQHRYKRNTEEKAYAIEKSKGLKLVDMLGQKKIVAIMDIATNDDDLHQPPQSYMNYAQNDPPTPPIPPPRPRRPTRQIPPLPPVATVNNESLVAVSNDSPPDGELAIEAQNNQPPVPALPQLTDLTPVRAHYLKKSLVQLQFRREIDAITTYTPNNADTLSFLGPPFSPPPKDAPFVDLPFLRYIFRQFVLTFPFMVAAPKDFYSEKLQPFVASALSRNLSSTSILDDDNADQASRKKLLARVERNLAMFVGSAIKLVEQEQVVRLNQSDLDRLENLARKRMAKAPKTRVVFEVNVIGVKTVVDKGREFIIRTRRTGFADVFVARRYGDFRTLAAELQKAHPNEQIRLPPPKDRTAVMSTPIGSTPPDACDPALYYPTSIPQSPSQAGLSTSRLAREKNRLTLRSYLHTLLATSKIASSPVIMSFLLSGPVKLTRAELEDAQRREEADNIREDGRKRFAKEIASRVDGLREAIKSVKGDVMGKDGLTHIFATIKVTPDVRDLPENYQAVLEWARISMASTVFHQFVASDNSSETFASLKRIHGLMPYFMLKGVLKISNPIAMIRGTQSYHFVQHLVDNASRLF
ncbi:hypothetical protein C0993_008780 [Termitomyces sp. T159_Od127]|nr:hypothetical protein C0993_008780 [Termitomyces sp. T159_Od127]